MNYNPDYMLIANNSRQTAVLWNGAFSKEI